MSGSPRHRPRGRLRSAAAMLTPMGVTAARLALERDAAARWRRLVAAAGDGARERVHPRRPRMRALVAAAGGRLGWRDVPAPPPPAPGAAVVHPIAIATCDLDRALVLGATPFPLPLQLGHECVAEVLAIGEEVTTVRPGQRVVVPFQISCGRCAPCRAELPGNCAAVPPISMYGFGLGGGHWGGALSDQLTVPYADAMLVPLPDGVDPAAAASVGDNVSDGWRHIGPFLPDLLLRDPDAEVVILGALARRSVFSPSVALYAGLVARALGARRVHLADGRASVREQAEGLGLQALRPSELRRRPPAPLVADISAHPRGLRLALTSTAPDGICSSVGGLYRNARIPAGLLYGRNVSYRVGRTHARTVIPRVLELMTEGRLHPETVTTTLASLDDAPGVLYDHVVGDGTKTILTA